LFSILTISLASKIEEPREEKRAMSGDCPYESSLIQLLKYTCNAYFRYLRIRYGDKKRSKRHRKVHRENNSISTVITAFPPLSNVIESFRNFVTNHNYMRDAPLRFLSRRTEAIHHP